MANFDHQIILNGTNYVQWKASIMAQIDEAGLSHVTQWNTIPIVDASNDGSPDNLAALQQCRQVRELIVETLDPTTRSMIHNSMTPKEILKLFESKYAIKISKYGNKNYYSRNHLLTYALVGFLSIILLGNFNNDDPENPEPHPVDPLTSLTFNKIYSKGLYATLERYRDQCVPELKGQIEQTIESVRSMEVSDDDRQLFTFANRRRLDTRPSGVMDYIGIAIRKVKGNRNEGQQGQQLFDYTIYTYVKPIEREKGPNLIVKIFNLINRLILGEEDSAKQMYEKDRIEALHTSFMAELVKRGILAKMDDESLMLN